MYNSPMNRSIPQAIAQLTPDGRLTRRQKRRLLIDMMLRRQTPGTGSSRQLMEERTAMHDWPDLRQILNGIPWVIVGGVATRAYMPERMTQDMDILIKHSDQEAVLTRLQKNGYTIKQTLSIPGYVLVAPNGVELDVLLGKQEWLEEALAKPTHDATGFPVLGLPYLVLMKMESGRGRDIGDITTMLGWADAEQLQAVRSAVAMHSPQDSDDLESLIFIGQQERNSST